MVDFWIIFIMIYISNSSFDSSFIIHSSTFGCNHLFTSYFNSDIGIHVNKQWPQKWKQKIPRLKKKWGKKKNVFAKFALVGKLIKIFFLKGISHHFQVACLIHSGSLKAIVWSRMNEIFLFIYLKIDHY